MNGSPSTCIPFPFFLPLGSGNLATLLNLTCFYIFMKSCFQKLLHSGFQNEKNKFRFQVTQVTILREANPYMKKTSDHIGVSRALSSHFQSLQSTPWELWGLQLKNDVKFSMRRDCLMSFIQEDGLPQGVPFLALRRVLEGSMMEEMFLLRQNFQEV